MSRLFSYLQYFDTSEPSITWDSASIMQQQQHPYASSHLHQESKQADQPCARRDTPWSILFSVMILDLLLIKCSIMSKQIYETFFVVVTEPFQISNTAELTCVKVTLEWFGYTRVCYLNLILDPHTVSCHCFPTRRSTPNLIPGPDPKADPGSETLVPQSRTATVGWNLSVIVVDN